MLVKCVLIYYQAGEFQLVQGVKKNHRSFNGIHVRGFGWGECSMKSDLQLTIESDELQFGATIVSVGVFF